MKDTVICLRISKDLRSALKRISVTDRRSLSSTVENILYDHVGQRNLKDMAQEKRRYPRKAISAPALVSAPNGAVHAGMICDISAGGICVSAPGDFLCETGEGSRISVVFTLPKSDVPLALECIPRHVRPGSRVHVGASFIDDHCPDHEAIRRHLVN